MNRALVAALLWPLAAAADPVTGEIVREPGPYYASGQLVSPIRAYLPPHQMIRVARAWLKTRGITTLAVHSGGRRDVLLPRQRRGPRLRDLDPAVLAALVNTLKTEDEGVETDLLVQVEGDARLPVTVRWDPASVDLVVGAPTSTLFPVIEDASVLLARWTMGEIAQTGVPWSGEHLGVVDEALRLLTPEERSLVDDLAWWRSDDPPDDDGDLLASYRWDIRWGYRLEFYQMETDMAGTVFVGQPDRPMPVELWTVLHELGHALADAPRRREIGPVLSTVQSLQNNSDRALALEEAVRDGDESVWAELDRLAEVRAGYWDALVAAGWTAERLDAFFDLAAQDALAPMEAAFGARLGDRYPCTAYGGSDGAEAFAECFALYKCDPAAFERIMPDLAAWFDDGGHLAAILAGGHVPAKN